MLDDGGPVGAGIQVRASNHLVQLYPKDIVVSDKAKGTIKCQVSCLETNANEPSKRPRYQISDVKTGILLLYRDK
jgi:hypothetical protein